MARVIITLTTDFGTEDGYVAAMKGVILGINPDATIVDVSHQVPPQRILHGAFVLGSASRYFGPETVHLAVVDPGVGTPRRALVLVTPEGVFTGPDNGIFSYVVLAQASEGIDRDSSRADRDAFGKPITVAVPEGCSAFALSRAEFWRHPVSSTFHGRDVFAPVAAHLSVGVPPESLGDPVGEVVCLSVLRPETGREGIRGRIVHVDRFGNLVTNISPPDLPGDDVEVEIAGRCIEGLSATYASCPGLSVLVGSHGWLEIAVGDGSAAAELGAGPGSEVLVRARRSRQAG